MRTYASYPRSQRAGEPIGTRSSFEALGRVTYEFGRGDKIRFVAIGITTIFAIPIGPIGGILNLLEVMTAIFVLLSPYLRVSLRRCLPLLLVLSYSVLAGQIMGTSGAAVPVATWAFLKIPMYVLFIDILVLSSRVETTRRWMLAKVVVPVTAIIMLSVLLDIYTPIPFGEFHKRFTYTPGSVEFMEWYYGGSFEDLWGEVKMGSGLAFIYWHVSPWAMCGLIATLILSKDGALSPRRKLLLMLLYLITPTLTPQRNSLVIMGSFLAILIVLSLLGQSKLITRKQAVSIFVVIAVLMGLQYTTDPYVLESIPGSRQTALQRFIALPLGFSYDTNTRIRMYVDGFEWFLDNPYVLLLGSGWNQIISVYSKPHSLYIGVLLGGGIFGFVTLVVFVRRLLREQLMGAQAWISRSDIALGGLCSLLATGITDNYLTGRLGTPAFFLALWVALSIVSVRSGKGDDEHAAHSGCAVRYR